MPSTLEDVRDTLTGQSHRRWLPWQRKPSLAERVGDVAEQAGQTSTDLTGQVAQTTGNLIQRLKGTSAPRAERGDVASVPFMADWSRGADFSAERAADAAEAASVAAQRAANAVDRLGGWLALLASRAPQTPLAPAPRESVPEAAFGENSPQGHGVTENIKRAAVTVGQRLSDFSDGRYGLEAQPPKAETKLGKKAQKRLERQIRAEAKAEQAGSSVRWFPWMLGMSIGLVLGLVGVAYWQRRRLQDFWEQTSQRRQRAIEETRQPLERGAAPTSMQANLPPGVSRSTPGELSVPTDENNQPANGRLESNRL